MATSYTTLLGFALPVTGELQGTWGNTVNNSITQLCEDSIAGVATASVLSSDWTLTTTGAGAANQARMAILIPTGSPGVSRNIIAPSKSKTYTVINQSNASVVIKGAATTGVSVASGDTVIVAWNGSDFVVVKNAAGTFTNLTYTGALTGSTGVMNIGSGQLYKDASGNVGIGTSSPITKLDVAGNGRFISTNSGATTSGAVIIRDYATDNSTGYVQWVDNANVNQLGAIGGIAGGGLKLLSGVTEAMRIDASGNVGIGTSSPSTKLQIDTGAAGYGLTLQASTQTSLKYQLGIDSSSNFNIYDTIAASKRLVIDSSGNVGIGTTTPAAKLDVAGVGRFVSQNSSATTTGAVTIRDYATDNSTGYVQWVDNANVNQLAAIGGIASGGLKFINNNSEVMRIDSSGNLLVGATSYTGAGVSISSPTASGSYSVIAAAGTGFHWRFGNVSNGIVGSISSTTTATSFTTSSDQRLKTDLGLATSTDVIDNTLIHDFEWKTDGSKSRGAFAQEAHVVKPEAVSVGTDELNEDGLPVHPWGVDYSKYVPDLIVYCQQLRKELDDLKSQLGK